MKENIINNKVNYPEINKLNRPLNQIILKFYLTLLINLYHINAFKNPL